MSDEPVADPPVATGDGGEDKDPAWYRDQMDRKDAQLKDQAKQINRQRVQLMEGAFDEVGLDPTKGLGKAIAEKYEGDPKADDLRSYAIEEYSWEPPVDDSLQSAVVDAQERVTEAVNAATPAPASPIDIQIADAEERGDFAGTMSLKVAKFREAQGI
jgi:hypothetical protein